MYLILEYATACTPSKLCVPGVVILEDFLPETLSTSPIYLLIYFISSLVILILTPSILSTISDNTLKFTVANSVISKSKFVFNVLIESSAPP